MRKLGLLTWLYTLFAVGLGIGFLAWSASLSAAAAEYAKAPICGAPVTSHCYELLPGTITSVEVSQTRSGERDTVSLATHAGALHATLEPSAAAAAHVRTGAKVSVERYQNQVTLVGVDGYWVPSNANPAANQGQLTWYGWAFVAVGLFSGAFNVYLRRRSRRRSLLAAAGLAAERPATAQPDLLPSGRIGWEVRPSADRGLLTRFGVGAAALLLITTRALYDPARRGWALLLDATLLGAGAVATFLFLHNTRVFADREEVGKTDLLGRTRSWRFGDILRADRFSVSTRAGLTRHLVFVTQDGRKAFEVAGQFWDFDLLDALVAAAGIKTSGDYEEVVGAFSLNKRVPGLNRWGQQAALLLLIIALIVPFVILVSGPTSR